MVISKLHQMLTSRLDDNELRTFCFYLNVPYQDLPGEGFSSKAREFILYLSRRGGINELIDVGKELRPDIPWDDLIIKHSEKSIEPQIDIRYDAENEPFIGYSVDAGNEPTAYYRLDVDNLGTNVLKNCQGILASVESLDGINKTMLGRPVTLKWAHEQTYNPINIEIGESRKLDLLVVFLKFPKFFEFYIDVPPFVGMSRRFPSGNYLANIRIMSEGTNLGGGNFIIELDRLSALNTKIIKQNPASG
ncbi:MAG: hypothetical protein IPM53_10880 [Anaerolineaceae bacterium]|nr:hypothetical protein [Anaerolineaceae bacterium]